MFESLRYLLLQVRNLDDPMRRHEVECFARALRGRPDQIRVMDLLLECPDLRQLAEVDVVLLGGSGDYSVAAGGTWMEPALDAMRELHAISKPTFASCWGFQAMAKALGGEVVTDISRAEVGTLPISLTPAGRRDPVFGPLRRTFLAQMGHQDIVDRLPRGAVALASSDRVENQAFHLRGKPIYCTQFHPELNLATLLDRLRQYPTYVQRITGLPFDEFVETRCTETPETDTLLTRFVETVFGPDPAGRSAAV